MFSRDNDIVPPFEGTCQWVLQHKTYKSWKSSDRGLLCIKGKPGSGKSTLLKYTLDQQRRLLSDSSEIFLSFFFFQAGHPLQKNHLSFLRSIAHQILLQVPAALPDLVNEFRRVRHQSGGPARKWEWQEQDLWHFVSSSLRKILASRPVWLFVDALNECGKAKVEELIHWCKTLLKTLSSTDLPCRICFTCRHYPILDQDFEFQICVERENARDISTYVRDRLSQSPELSRSTIPSSIVDRASGFFLWVHVMVKEALEGKEDGDSEEHIEKRLQYLTGDLSTFYGNIAESMESDSRKLIEWICFATRPLSVDELRWAMAVEPDCPHRSLNACQNAEGLSNKEEMEKRVQTLSRGLAEIVFSSGTHTVQFIHPSAKDFFIQEARLMSIGNSTTLDTEIGMAHFRLSRTCIRYLMMEEIGQSIDYTDENMTSNFPLLHYAVTSWVEHTKQSDANGIPQGDVLELFGWPSAVLVDVWRRVYESIDKYSTYCPPKGTSLVHIVARYEISGLLLIILSKVFQESIDVDLDIEDEQGRTPLEWASTEGHKAVVDLISDANHVYHHANDHYYHLGRPYAKTMVRRAIECEHKEALETLIEKGWVDAYNVQGMLSDAAEEGQEWLVWLLLEKGAGAHTRKDTYHMPLLFAAEGGHEGVVRLLLNKGASLEVKNRVGWTPLTIACDKGHKAVVKLLLEKGANTEAKNEFGRTPLSYAVARGHLEIIEVLLENDADTMITDDLKRTPLSWAAGELHEALVKQLVEKFQADKDSRQRYS